MPLEIDMLSVENADAILIRTIDDTGEHVVVIDAGRPGHASDVINHIRNHYGDNTTIDLLINSHPHDDHVGGIGGIVDDVDITIKQVLIHDPCTFQNQLESIPIASRQNHFELMCHVTHSMKSLRTLNDVIKKLDCKGIPHFQPFAGQVYNLRDEATLTVVGPTEEFYAELAPSIKSLTDVASPFRALKAISEHVETRSDEEIVDEHDDTSAFNNSSAILLLTHGSNRYLFTADAGPKAFRSAIAWAKDCGQESLLTEVDWMQIPHHGSKANITSDLIKYFQPRVAYVSAKGGDDINHPSAEVVRLYQKLERDGQDCKVFGTNRGRSLWRHMGTPDRDSYSTAEPLNSEAQ